MPSARASLPPLFLLFFLLLAAFLPAVSSVSSLDALDCSPEYVIVGAGCAGAIVASRLAQEMGSCVVLFERGLDDSYSELSTIGIPVDLSFPSFHWLAQPQFAPEIAETVWLDEAWSSYSRQWSTLPFTADAPSDFSEWQMAFKVLGGGSSGNAMVYNRGNWHIFQSWGWKDVWDKYDDLEASMGPFENSEHTAAPEAFVVLQAFRDVLGWEGPEEGKNIANGEESLVGFYDKAIKDGLRSSVPRNFLPDQVRNLPNLAILLETEVTKIIFEGTTAVGVEFHNLTDGATGSVTAANEVIISAGPYISPHLLMKSGIGPKASLEEHGIEVLVDLPGVGQNYKNHLFLPLVVNLKQPYSETILNPPPTSNGGDFIGHWYSDLCLAEDCDAPDMQTAWSYYAGYAHYLEPPYVQDSLAAIRTDPLFNGTANLWTMCTQPASTGHLEPNPGATYPRTVANFLSDERDVEVMVDGVKKMRSVAESLPDYMEEVSVSAGLTTDEELREYVKQYAMGQYHPAGTCKMGDGDGDEMAVVDQEMRVYGVEHLRVVDSSIMPRIQNGNPSAPSMLIGYHAADLIMEKKSGMVMKGKRGKKGKKGGDGVDRKRTLLKGLQKG